MMVMVIQANLQVQCLRNNFDFLNLFRTPEWIASSGPIPESDLDGGSASLDAAVYEFENIANGEVAQMTFAKF